MAAAKYYIYRNLNKGGFSIKYKGHVVGKSDNLICIGVDFKVSAKGRERCLKEQRRNVHAYATCGHYPQELTVDISTIQTEEVKYNPYKAESFTVNGKPLYHAERAYFVNGRCYIRKGA